MTEIMKIEQIVKTIEQMEFNTTISIASDCDENGNNPEGWWSITKLSVADSHTLLFNFYGGGYPYAYSIDEADETETITYALKDFLNNNQSFYGEDTVYFVDKNAVGIGHE